MLWNRDRLYQSLVAAALVLAIGLTAALAAEETPQVSLWEFGPEEATPLHPVGGVERDQAGPRPPEFPDFASNNTSAKFDGKGARFEIADPGPASPYDFTNGDPITIEAWIKGDKLRDGSPAYIIGKGRTGNPRFPKDNQNWSLRIVTSQQVSQLSFLFATEAGSDRWHRWTSKLGFDPETDWHHVAVTYKFGEPESIHGWIDGRPTDGDWDMGGPTRELPVVDDDAVWIGSSLGGNPGNSFKGWLDSVALHRSLVDDKFMTSRFRRVGGPRVLESLPERMPELGEIPEGRVLFTISEGFPTHDRWLNLGETDPAEAIRWLGDEFLLPRLPIRHDDWGIRDAWKAPILLRIAADIDPTSEPETFLVRARALGRLWVDGQVVARTEALTKSPPSGEEAVTPLAEPLLPGLRVPGYRMQEVTGKFDPQAVETTTLSSANPPKHRIVLELVVGGKSLRTETGETCVARKTQDGNSYEVLRPSGEPLPLTDAAVEPVLARIENWLRNYDDETRRTNAASQDQFWAQRHETARQWATQWERVPEIQPPGEGHPIDAFISSKIKQAVDASSQSDPEQAAQFHNKVLPILREHCFRCHGDKDKGGLKLDTLEASLKGGDSEAPAIVPGDPEASELILRIESDEEGIRMPPTGTGLAPEQIEILTHWIKGGAAWPPPPVDKADVASSQVIDDAAFLRRVYLDTIGVPPTPEKLRELLGKRNHSEATQGELPTAPVPLDRNRVIDELLDDERFADHWVSYWLDLLAENPPLINAALNSTGPFRWYIHDSLRDRKPFDRLVTELMLMRGGRYEGGAAGFAMAAENDSPFAAKGHIVASAFLGIELQCARCHDSPYHSTTQRDLYALAAMFDRKPTTVPKTSRVPAAFFEKNKSRDSLIRVTLKPDEAIDPVWPFADATGVVDGPEIDRLMQSPTDSRERLAALITAPQDLRFSRVIVNRLWKQLLGAGFVEPVYDWEGRQASHPELLDWLAYQFITHDYDVRHVIRLILTSQTYQREATGHNLAASAPLRFFNAPERRRLTAEQIVDSLFTATGSTMDVEELTFVHDGRRPISNRNTLGCPTRAWMFAGLNNERDRPSLSLPRAQSVADVLESFGWTGTRQKPITERDPDPNLLQPGVLANGTLTMALTRASYGSELSQLAINAESPAALVDELFLRVLTRLPTPNERTEFTVALSEGFDTRLVPADQVQLPPELPQLPLVTWFNHLQSESNVIQKEHERRVRQGPPPDPRLRPEWREIYEDLVWSLINHREFVWIP